MHGKKTPIKIILTEEERVKLNGLIRSFKTPVGLLERAKIVIMLSEDHSLSHISRVVGIQRRIVRKWGKRFMEKRLKGLEDEPRSGRPPVFSPRGSSSSDKDGL
ncbi:MAG: helix-turn-helix domain-containing protein [Candidatus Eremiobacterota bacterium]